jgi:hypothetical protein
MRGRLVTAAVVAGAIGAALFAMAADRDDARDAAPSRAAPRERAGSAAQPPPAAHDAPAGAPASSAPVPKRARVPAGVLARAASRRAQEREAGAPAPERRRGREQGDVISVEIDWHAGSATP